MAFPFVDGGLGGWVLASRILKGVAGLVMGLLMLGFVVQHSGVRSVEVAVHVVEPDVEVTIGDVTQRIEGRTTRLITFEVPRGRHTLITTRNGETLSRFEFVAGEDEGLVLTAPFP
ncbi:MAG: hypothetical protein AB7I30_23520 [Isosphaeraceae bacterium]